jgi:general secretion pathway protein G
MMNNIQSPPNAPRLPRRLRQERGYTLIEIMLVLSIISVLLGAGIYYMAGNLDSAKERRVEADIATFSMQLKNYESENYFMPTTEQGLLALYQEPTSDPKPRRWRQWLEKPPIDPWGMPYMYRNPGIHNPNGFDLYSYGAAKKENDKEIGNWDDNNK